MAGKIKYWYRGYVRINVIGFSTERFLNLCCMKGIEIWDLRSEKAEIHGCMSVRDFRKVRPLVKKTGVRIRIQERIGCPFILYRNRKRKGLAAGLAVFFILLYSLSLFIWNISFEGNYHFSRDTLLSFLETEGIQYGIRKQKLSCEALEEAIRSEFPEIIWVSASVSGTRLLVKIKENEVLSVIPQKEQGPCDIISQRSGVITEMIVRQGKAQIGIGDVVEPGQLLVSSTLSIRNDSGEVVRTAYVQADADIYATTQYRFQEKVPKIRAVTMETGKKRLGASITIGSWQWKFLMPARGDETWHYASENHQLCLFQDFYLPVSMTLIRGNEMEVYEARYTENEISMLAEQINESYLKNLLEKGVHIIENSVKIQENGFFYIIEGTATVREQIGIKQPVKEMEQVPREIEETIEVR